MAERRKDPQKKLALAPKTVDSRLGMPRGDIDRTPLIAPQLRETRTVRIGMKEGEVRQGAGGVKWRRPIKLDWFRITKRLKNEKDDFVVDEEFHEEFGKKPTEIPIQLLFDTIYNNIMVYLALYQGRKAFCKGDGTKASRLQQDGSYKEIECPCPLLAEGKCKYHIVFHFKLPGMAIGECAKFRSTGKNSIKYIQGGLWMVKQAVAEELGCSIDEAPLRNIPLTMKLMKETVNGPDGKTYVIPVVHVGFQGTTNQLREIVVTRQKVRKADQQALLKYEAKRYKALLAPESAEEARDISEEFHPEHVDDDPTKVIEGTATKVEPDAKREPAADRIDKASKEARSRMPAGIQRALDSEDELEDPDPARGDVDLPSRPAGEKKPKEKKDEWL